MTTWRSYENDRIDFRVDDAKAEVKEMAARAIDALTVKVGWMLRSTGQIRRFGTAKEHLQKGD